LDRFTSALSKRFFRLVPSKTPTPPNPAGRVWSEDPSRGDWIHSLKKTVVGKVIVRDNFFFQPLSA